MRDIIDELNDSISPILGVLLLVAVTIGLSIIVISLTFDVGSSIEDKTVTQGAVTTEKQKDSLRVTSVVDSSGKMKLKNSDGEVIAELGPNSQKEIRYYKFVDSKTQSGQLSVVQNGKVTQTLRVNLTGGNYDFYADPSKLKKDEVKLVRKSYVFDTKTRYRGTYERYTVKFEDNKYDPDDFSYSWYNPPTYSDCGYYNRCSKVRSTSKDEAKYEHIRNTNGDNNHGGARMDITKPNGTSYRLTNYTDVDNAIQNVKVVSRGVNEISSSESTRFRGTTENFAVTNVKLHEDLEGDVSDSLSNFKYQWYDGTIDDNCGFYNECSVVRSQTENESEYEHVRTTSKGESNRNVRVDVWLSETGKDGDLRGRSSFPVDNPIQNVKVVSRGVNEISSSESTRFRGTTEDFAVTNITLHKDLEGDVSDSLSNFKYQWYDGTIDDNCGFYNECSVVRSQTENESTYEHVRTTSKGESNRNIRVDAWLPEIGKDGDLRGRSSFPVDNPLQDIKLVSRGVNEISSSESTRFRGTTEDFAVTNITLHKDLEGDVSDSLSNFDYQWYDGTIDDNCGFYNECSVVRSQTENESTYEHVRTTSQGESNRNVRMDAWLEVIGQDGDLGARDSFAIDNAIRDVTYVSEEYGSDFTTARPVDSFENYSVSSVTIHPDLKGDISDSPSSFNYNWYNPPTYSDCGYYNQCSKVRSESNDEAKYEHIRSSSGDNRHGGARFRIWPDFTGNDGKSSFRISVDVD